MNLYCKSPVSKFVPCVSWLRVHALLACLYKVHWVDLDGVVGGRYQRMLGA